MGAEYHYSRDGQSFGPVSVEQLRQLAATGQVTANDLVWKEGMAEWLPAGRFKGLIPSSAAATAPAQVRPISAAPAMVVPSEDSAHEFRMSEPAPAPVVAHPAIAAAEQAHKSEPIDDATQAEVFARQAKQVAVAAGTDALKAFKVMAKNPVGGLRVAYENLGPTRAMQVGIVFAIIFDLSMAFAGQTLMSSFNSVHGNFGSWIVAAIKLMVIGLIPFGAAVGGFAAVRASLKGEGSIFSDMFVAGASLVPATIFFLASRILTVANAEVVFVIFVFAVTTTILILYSGFTTLQRIPEAVATLVVPLVIVVGMYACKIMLGILM
ncbi:MAG TPA: DUF4339 domain-containing protein [Pirellulales bacterium]|jgi:hypothetical protein|nr:DUF4339 domain-containing protein [Pirellulales bacterium]